MIDELLDVSRIESGKLRLDVQPLDLGRIVLEAVEVIRSAADAKHIALATAVDPGGYPVLGDADRLRQVVWNLLSNAIKFTPAGGTVGVTVERRNGHVRLTVTDTGQGIAPAFLPFVFERFRQGDTSSTRRHGGLGIGLTIARELTELHGGRVAAESAGEGHGATFTVELPMLADERHAVRPVDARPSQAAALDGMRVLVVDDDPDSNDAVRNVLASAGAVVRTAASTDEALAVLSRWLPDVLVSDLAMPNEDGYALLARMRSDAARLGRIPAIALTALSAPDDRAHALSAGFSAHVAKPPRTDELLHAVVAARHSLAT
jgi:CheY-like chemotaxis protein